MNIHNENKKLNRNVYNMARGSLYYEMLDFES